MNEKDLEILGEHALASYAKWVSQQKSMLAQREADLQKEMHRRYSKKFDTIYQARGSYGSATLNVGHSAKVRCTVPKRVEWDQEILQSMHETALPIEIGVKYAVSEKTYKEASELIRLRLDEARTVKYGTPKITMELDND